MNKIIRNITVFLMLYGFTVLYATGNQEKPAAEEIDSIFLPVTVTDIRGRDVTVKNSVERIAYIHHGTAETLKILNVWDKVVARAGYINDELFFPGIKDIPVLGPPMGNPYEPNYELLFGLGVDLLIVEDIPMPGLEDMLAHLKGIIPVVVVKTYEPGGLVEGLQALARILGEEKNAQDYIMWYTAILDNLSNKTANLTENQKPKIFFKHGYGAPSDVMTFTDEMSYAPFRNRIAGCINIAADLPSQGGWAPAVDPEWLIMQSLDALIIADPIPGAFGSSASGDSLAAVNHLEAVRSLPVFAESKAVKDQAAYIIGGGLFGTPRFIVGFAYMAKWFHPDLFADFDPQKIHQQYLTQFMRVNLNLSEQGFYVYPKE